MPVCSNFVDHVSGRCQCGSTKAARTGNNRITGGCRRKITGKSGTAADAGSHQ